MRTLLLDQITDLAEPPTFEHWATDLASPGLVAMLQKKLRPMLAGANASLRFGPGAGPPFFEPFGQDQCRELLRRRSAMLSAVGTPPA